MSRQRRRRDDPVEPIITRLTTELLALPHHSIEDLQRAVECAQAALTELAKSLADQRLRS